MSLFSSPTIEHHLDMNYAGNPPPREDDSSLSGFLSWMSPMFVYEGEDAGDPPSEDEREHLTSLFGNGLVTNASRACTPDR